MTPRQQEKYQAAMRAVRRMRRQGLSLAEAAKAEGISGRTVVRYARPAVRQDRHESHWKVRSRDRLFRRRYVPVRTDAGWDALPVTVTDSRTASVLGRYWRSVQLALAGDSTEPRKFRGRHVTVAGQRYPLPTDPDLLADLAEQGSLDFDAEEEVGS
jgi:hypothetical protein